MPAVDEIDPLARRVGAINTLLVRDGRWIGANTDVEGFLAPLTTRRRGVSRSRAREPWSSAQAAQRAPSPSRWSTAEPQVTISARRPEAARTIAEAVGCAAGELPPRGSTWDLLVNATTVGSTAVPGNPMDGAPMTGGVVFDLVYAPAETELLEQARAAGCETIGGIEMLIAQAERQFELWTGQRPPTGLFRDVTHGGVE